MAINLLKPGGMSVYTPPTTGGMSKYTPQPQPNTVGMNTPMGNKLVPVGGSQAVAHPLSTGVNAKSPATNVVGPSNTLQTSQINTSKPAAPITQPAPPQSPYSNTLGLLGQAAQNNPYTQYNQQTANYGAGNVGLGNKAQDIADEYGKKMADVGARGIRYEGGQLTTGTSPVAEGNAAVTANLTAQQQQALAQAGNMALSGNEQALTGQNQAAIASNLAAGQSNTAQGYLQGAYNTIAGYQKPELGSIGQVPFNPQTGSQGAILGSTGGGLQQAGQLLGQFAGSQTLGAAPYNAQAQNTITSGTATPEAYRGIYQNALNDYTNLQQSVQNVDQFGNLLTSNMTSGGINPSDVKYANQTLAQIRGQLSSGAQAQYDTTLAALKSKVSGMLSVGGNETPTAITADAQKILDGSLPLSALNDVLSRIQTEGNILLTNQANKVNTAKSGTMAPGTNQQPQQTTSSGAKGWL